jgi:membrane protein implicated in regulation of membrane protease activity
MPFLMLVAGLVGGLAAVGLLLLLEAVLRAFHPGWTLPFSAWWGLLLALPAMSAAIMTGARAMGRRSAPPGKSPAATERGAGSSSQ